MPPDARRRTLHQCRGETAATVPPPLSLSLLYCVLQSLFHFFLPLSPAWGHALYQEEEEKEQPKSKKRRMGHLRNSGTKMMPFPLSPLFVTTAPSPPLFLFPSLFSAPPPLHFYLRQQFNPRAFCHGGNDSYSSSSSSSESGGRRAAAAAKREVELPIDPTAQTPICLPSQSLSLSVSVWRRNI